MKGFPRRMPTYEYFCQTCKKSFDLFQSMKDPALRTCPKELCQARTWKKGKVTRMLGTGAGVIFKGSGFYSTDYRSPSYQEAAKKESGAPAETAKPESTPKKPETAKSDNSTQTKKAE
jgi:putative FmdB family regulatory protein